MRSILKIASLACMALASLQVVGDGGASYEGEILWWMVGDPSDFEGEISGVTIFDVDGTTPIAPNGDGSYTVRDMDVNAARVRVTGGDIGTDDYVYLNLVSDKGGTVQVLTPPTTGYVPDEFFAAVVPYASEEYSFMVELGNYDYDNGTWYALAASEALSYATLKDATRNIAEWSVNEQPTPTGGAWAPSAYTVPEPTGGLLFLVGGGLLALRRRRNGGI